MSEGFKIVGNSEEPIGVTYFKDGEVNSVGLTKREYTCIKLGIPDSGCDEINAIIIKAERKRLAGLAMQGMMSAQTERFANGMPLDQMSIIAYCKESIQIADELLKQLDQ